MTTINACICGKYDESQDLENDFQDKHGPLNKHVLLLDFLVRINLSPPISLKFLFYSKIKQPSIYIPTNRIERYRLKLDADDLNELRKKRLLEIKMGQIMKEISIYLLFLFVLFVVAFSNLSSSSFQYNQLFLNTFVNKQSGENMGLNEVNLRNDFNSFINLYHSWKYF